MGGSGHSSLWVVVVAIVVTTALLSPAADAQTPSREEPFPQLLKGIRWGPFLVERRFSIDNIGYDDNVFRTIDDDAAESDFIIALGPEIRAQLLFGPNMAVTVRDRLSGEVFLRNSELNHADNTLDGQYDLLLGPVLLTSTGRWSTTRQRPNSEIDERTRVRTRDLGQAVRLFLSPRIDVSARFEERRRRFTDEDRLVTIDPDGDGTASRVTIGEALDRTEEALRGEIGWRLAGGTRLFVGWSEKDVDFESDAAGRDATDERTTLGLDLSPTASLRGRVEVGRAELRSTDPAFNYTPFDGTIGEAEISYLPTGSTRITLNRGLDVRFSTFDRNLFFEEDLFGLSLESYLGSRWGLQAGWEKRDLEYPEENSVALPRGERRRDEIKNVYAGFIFRLIGNAELGIRIGVRERDSNAISFLDRQKYVTTTGSYDF